MNKFSNITFPFFGLTKVPDKVIYNKNKILVEYDRVTYLVDNKIIDEAEYIKRLFYMDTNCIARLKFNYTALSLSQIINSDIKCGFDNTCKFYNLAKKQKFVLESFKVLKITDNMLWVKGVSYPIIITTSLPSDINNKYLYADMVYINDEWVLYKFSYSKNSKKEILL